RKTWVASVAAIVLMALGLIWLWPSNESSIEDTLLVGNNSEELRIGRLDESVDVPSIGEVDKSSALVVLTAVSAKKIENNLASLEKAPAIRTSLDVEKASMNVFALESPISQE